MAVKNISKRELLVMIDAKEDFELIDVREQDEWDHYHIKGARLIPMSIFQLKYEEIDFSKTVVLYCNSGARSNMLANMLSQQGKEVLNLEYGIQEFDNNDNAYIDK